MAVAAAEAADEDTAAVAAVDVDVDADADADATCTRFPFLTQMGTQGYTLVHPKPYWSVQKKGIETNGPLDIM